MPLETVEIYNSNGDVVGWYTKDTDPPPPRTKLTRYEFRSQFTAAEKMAMYESTDTLIKVFLDDVQSAEYIELTNQDTIDGVNYLEAQSIISAGRAAEILTGISD